MPKYVKPKAFDIIADILQMQKDIKALQIKTNGAATAAAPSVNTLTLVDGAAPATPVGGTTLFSETGNLGYVGEDGNVYDTGTLHLSTPSTQTVNSASDTPITGLITNLAATTYRVTGLITIQGNQAAGIPNFTFHGVNASPCVVTGVWLPTNSGATAAPTTRYNNSATHSGGFGGGPTLTVSPAFCTLIIYAFFNFTVAPAPFSLQANTSVAADTYVVQPGSWLDIMPVA
jgi:hypothetical protein